MRGFNGALNAFRKAVMRISKSTKYWEIFTGIRKSI
jgi:hypothetical protein